MGSTTSNNSVINLLNNQLNLHTRSMRLLARPTSRKRIRIHTPQNTILIRSSLIIHKNLTCQCSYLRKIRKTMRRLSCRVIIHSESKKWRWTQIKNQLYLHLLNQRKTKRNKLLISWITKLIFQIWALHQKVSPFQIRKKSQSLVLKSLTNLAKRNQILIFDP